MWQTPGVHLDHEVRKILRSSQSEIRVGEGEERKRTARSEQLSPSEKIYHLAYC